MTHSIVIIGGRGKTGKRIIERLAARGIAARPASRGTSRRFDWTDPSSWRPALEGAAAAYVAYQPDLAVPRAESDIAAFAEAAVAAGVGHVVLLSGRGEAGAEASEERLRAAPVSHTVLRASWFAENFTEGAFRDGIAAGELALPADAVREPFVSADDIADAAVAALADPAHRGRTYVLTGPRLLTFAEAVAEIAAASRRDVAYRTVPMVAFLADLRAAGFDQELTWLMEDLFAHTLDGRNASVADDLPRLIGRPATDFAAVIERAARQDAWQKTIAPPEAGDPVKVYAPTQ